MLTLPTHAADVLAGFFASAESDAGMRSTFGAFVALAQSGVRCDGGTKDHEINVTDRRYGWRGEDGEVRTGTAGRSRSVWKALRLLSGDVQNVLYAAHGPTDWAKLVDASFGRGTATKLTKLVGPHLGVALLTPTVAKGLADALAKAEPVMVSSTLCEGRTERRRFVEVEDPETREVTREVDVTPSLPRIVLAAHEGEPTKRVVERTALWNTTGGWLVATARVEGKAVDIAKANDRIKASPLCTATREEAARLLLDAHTAYAAACSASGRAVYLVDASSEQARRKAPRARERVRQEKVTGAEVAAWG